MNLNQHKSVKPNLSSSKAVTLHSSNYAYEKLRVCTHCGCYTALQEPACLSCDKKNTLRSITWKAENKVRRAMRNELWLTLLITLLSILFARNMGQIVLSCAGGAVALVVLRLLQLKMLPQRTPLELVKLFNNKRQDIVDGLIKNLDTAVEVGKSDHLRSYQMFRQVSTLVQNDHIRMLQIMQLQSLVIRSDMDVELEPLLLKRFDPHLAAYIGELAKVKRELIKDKAFRYVISFEDEILDMENGLSILTGVAGATVRKKRYVVAYSAFLTRYARKLPKDRFLRLYRVVISHPEQDWGDLGNIVSKLYEEKYERDAESQRSLARGQSI